MELTNRTDLEVFANKLKMANIEIPNNLKIIVELTDNQYNSIIPIDFKFSPEVEYNSDFGIKFILKNKDLYN